MEELNLKELFDIFWSKKIQVVLLIAIFIVIGIIYTMGFVTPIYTSSTSLVLATAANTAGQGADTITATDINLNSKLVPTYSELVKSKNVIRQVKQNLGIDISEGAMRESVTVSSVKGTELIVITVKNQNPTYAANIANEIAKVFTEKVGEIYNINNVHIVDVAEIEKAPSNVNHMKDLAIFAGIGFVIAAAYVLIANMLDTTIKAAEDVEREFKIPVLASIPFYEKNITAKNKKGGRR